MTAFGWKYLITLCCSIGMIVACAPAPLTAENTVELHVVRGDSPSSLIGISDVRPADAQAIFTGKLSPLVQASFWFANNSDRPVVAIATTWVVAKKDGSIRTERFTADSFLITDARPVVEPHRRLLVAPRFWLKEESMGQYAASPNFARTQGANLGRTLEEFAQAGVVRVEIDSVIFADGEVVGSNRTRFDSEITERKAAAETVLAALDKAGPDADARRSALLRIISERIAPSESSVVWQHRFAQQLLHSRNSAGTVDYLRRLPKPPSFHSNTNSSSTQIGLGGGGN